MLRDAIIAATENVTKLYELSGDVDHGGEKGAFREFFMKELIRPYIPEHFGVSSGIVVDANGCQSKQSDIVIYDRRLLPPIMLAGESGTFPIDSVLVVLEVKSTLKAYHYETLVDAGRRFSPKTKDNPDGLQIARPGALGGNQAIWPSYAVFGYTSDAPNKDEFKRLEEQVHGGNQYIKLIGVLDKGVWSERETHSSPDVGENAVKFLLLLLNKLEDTAASRGKYRLQDWL